MLYEIDASLPGDKVAIRINLARQLMLPQVRLLHRIVHPSWLMAHGASLMAHPSQYFTHIRNNPSGGSVVPAAVRSTATRIFGTSSGSSLPRPTSTKVPAMIRTML